MAYEHTEWEHEPEPQASSSRSGGPPRKTVGTGVLDPPLPPTSRTPHLPIGKILAVVILIGIIAFALLLLVPRH